MVSPVTAADLSRFKTQRIGTGTFGAKEFIVWADELNQTGGVVAP